ncbi:hypothetical protein Efla_004658 [Eimeria flavescens]
MVKPRRLTLLGVINDSAAEQKRRPNLVVRRLRVAVEQQRQQQQQRRRQQQQQQLWRQQQRMRALAGSGFSPLRGVGGASQQQQTSGPPEDEQIMCLEVPSALRVYEQTAKLRGGPAPSEGRLTLSQALVVAPAKVTFLHVDCLKGSPVDLQLKETTPDPYFAQHVRDFYSLFFGNKQTPTS